VKLLDFGIAKATEAATFEDHTKTGALKGKVHYMAPEQCKQEPLDRRADVFALGIVAWELFAQERLFKRDSDLDSMQAIVTGDLKNMRKIRRDVPGAVVEAIERALRPNKAERYNSADEMRRALLDAAAKLSLRADPDSVASFVKPLLGEVHARRTAELLSLANEKTQATPAHEAATDDATLVEKRGSGGAKVIEVAEGNPESSRRAKSRTGSGVKPVQHKEEPPSSTALARPKSRAQKRRSTVLRAALLGVAIVALIAGVLVLRSRLSHGPTGTSLRMVFPPVADRELIAADVQPLQQYLQDVLGRPVLISVATSYDDLLQTVVAQRADIGVLPPNTYVQAKARDPRIEILASKIIDGATGSDGEIYVSENSAAKSIADLKGIRFCFSDPLSTTGYVLPRKAMRQAGLDPDKDLVSHISGTHTQVLRDIVDGVCEAGATYSGGYLAADRAGIPVARLRQLAMTGRTPQDAICATASLSPADRKKVQDALFSFDMKKAGTIGGRVERISGFAHSTDKDYDAVREMAH
jgi:phosphate/phosphite/phosphonate ABC transporter binding protein